MKIPCIFFTILGSLFHEPAIAQSIEQLQRIDGPAAEIKDEYDYRLNFAEWINDSEIVTFTRDFQLSRIDIATKKKAWSRSWKNEICDFCVSQSGMIGLVSNGDRTGPSVILVDATDGSTALSKTSDELAKLSGLPFFIPSRITIHPVNGQVLVSNFSTHFWDNAYIFDPKLNSVEKRLGIDSTPKKIAFTRNGERLTILADTDVLNVRSVEQNADVFFAGKRISEPRKGISFTIDAPVYSNAIHDGRDLIVYSRDNSWGTGSIYIHRLSTKKTIEFDGLNGHIVMDVDFANERIAVSGTSKDIVIFDFSGNRIAKAKNPTGERYFQLRYSPNGGKLMVCNDEDHVWIFAITEQ